MKKVLVLLMVSLFALVICSSLSFADMRFGAFSTTDGTPSGLLMRIDNVWDVQLSSTNSSVGTSTSTFSLMGTYYFTSVRTLDFGGFLSYASNNVSGNSTISLGGSVKTPLIGEVSVKCDAYVFSSYGGGNSGSDFFPLAATVAFVILI